MLEHTSATTRGAFCSQPERCNNADAVRELIDVGRDGEVVSNANELSSVLERLLRDKELRERLGEQGYNKVRSRFTWDHVVQRGLDILEEVCSERDR